MRRGVPATLFLLGSLRLFGCGALIELINATGGVYGLGVSCVEGVRSARNFDGVHGVFLAVIPLVLLRRRDGRGNKKTLTRCGVVEYHLPIVLRVNVFFHSDSTIARCIILTKSARLPSKSSERACAFWSLRAGRRPEREQFFSRKICDSETHMSASVPLPPKVLPKPLANRGRGLT